DSDRWGRPWPIITSLIALCPMMGLLGTVTGMIEVFDVMALQGTGDARSMAGGVSRATLPTMAGMVVALSGLFFASRLKRLVNKKTNQFADSLGFV
ncbi:MotA/TolQ/ExbB proton channel family protein, partial [bacterium]|nr:MotA/TolQ/ExbB proton channel family protein [bacterium]